jgi:hypothetical protein
MHPEGVLWLQARGGRDRERISGAGKDGKPGDSQGRKKGGISSLRILPREKRFL